MDFMRLKISGMGDLEKIPFGAKTGAMYYSIEDDYFFVILDRDPTEYETHLFLEVNEWLLNFVPGSSIWEVPFWFRHRKPVQGHTCLAGEFGQVWRIRIDRDSATDQEYYNGRQEQTGQENSVHFSSLYEARSVLIEYVEDWDDAGGFKFGRTATATIETAKFMTTHDESDWNWREVEDWEKSLERGEKISGVTRQYHEGPLGKSK